MRSKRLLVVILTMALGAAGASGEEARIHGTCTDEDGAALAGAELILYYNPFPLGWGKLPQELGCRVVARTKTDAEGAFAFPDRPLTYRPDHYLLRHPNSRTAGYFLLAKHSDRAVSAALLERGKETAPQHITLRPGFQQRVYAVTPGRKARVPGVAVWLHLIRERKDGFPGWTSGISLNENIGWVSATTDANGECVLSNLPPVDCCFFATKPGYASTWRGGIKAPNARNVWFDMTPGAFANGRAVLPDGRPAANLLVKFVVGGNRTWVSYAVTNERGEFRSPPLRTYEWDRTAWKNLDQLHDGVVTVMADQFLEGGEHAAGEPVRLQTKDEKQFDDILLQVKEATTIPLHVKLITPDKRPLQGFGMHLLVSQPGMRSYEQAGSFDTDQEGAASIELRDGETVWLSPKRSMKRSGWYIPREGSDLYISWMHDRWTTDRSYRPSRDLFGIAGGKGTREAPLIIEANVVPAKRLSGVVEDEAGYQYANCSVYSVYSSGGVKADTNGEFAFESLPAGRGIRLFATTKDRTLAGFTDTDAAAQAGVVVRMKPTKDYAGRCLDSEGVPVGKVLLGSAPMLEGSLLDRLRQDVTTDAQGRFELQNACPDATYKIWWSFDKKLNRDLDYGSQLLDLSQIPEDEPFIVEVKCYIATIRGAVVDQDGNPIQGAGVQVPDGWSMLPQHARNGLAAGIWTDENGRFKIGPLAKGTVDLIVRHNDYKGLKLSAVPTDSVDVEAVLQPKGEFRVTVRVVGVDGEPVAGARLLLRGARGEADPEVQREAATDDGGTCAFLGLTQNRTRWTLFCDVPGHYYEARHVEGGLDSDCVIALRRIAGPVKGTVRDSHNRPVSGAKVRAHGIGAPYSSVQDRMIYGLPEDMLTVYTDERGLFAFPRLPRDRSIMLFITADGFATRRFASYRRRDKVPEDKDIAVTLSPGCAISGTVRYEGTEKPAVGVRLKAQGLGTWQIFTFARTDQAGGYRMASLEPGAYTISVTPEGDAADWTCEPRQRVQVEAGQTLENQDLLLIKGVPISGTVTDGKTNKPLENARVQARVKNQRHTGIHAVTRTDAEGRYLLRVPPGRTYTVTAQRPRRLGPIRPESIKEVVAEEGTTCDNIDFVLKP